MIDVQIRKLLEPRHDKVDEPLEGGFLFGPRKGPVRGADHSSVGAGEGVTEQIFAASLPRERIAFKIEEDVARRRLRQKRQAEARHDRQQFMEDLSRFPACYLNSRLFAHPLIAVARTAIRLPGHWQRHSGKAADRRYGAALQLGDLQTGDTRDEG